MLEQKYFRQFLPEASIPSKTRAALMLTYEQVISIASALAEVERFANKTALTRLFCDPLVITEAEMMKLTAIHNACINAALSIEEYERSKGSTNDEK